MVLNSNIFELVKGLNAPQAIIEASMEESHHNTRLSSSIMDYLNAQNNSVKHRKQSSGAFSRDYNKQVMKFSNKSLSSSNYSRSSYRSNRSRQSHRSSRQSASSNCSSHLSSVNFGDESIEVSHMVVVDKDGNRKKVRMDKNSLNKMLMNSRQRSQASSYVGSSSSQSMGSGSSMSYGSSFRKKAKKKFRNEDDSVDEKILTPQRPFEEEK